MAAIVGRQNTAIAFVGSSEALTAEDRMKHVISFTLPTPEAEEVDVTDFDSEGKETENGDVDYGTLEINYHLVDADQYDKLEEMLETGTTVHFQCFIKNKDGQIIIGKKGKGTVKSNGLEGVERNSALNVTASIKVSGKTTKVAEMPAGAEA